MALPPYQLIDNAEAWRRCVKKLRREPRIAVDLEANSLYAYREQICLIQLSIPGEDFIIDPLADYALDEFGGILANPRIEKIFHASDYDLMLLKSHYDWEVTNLFDTMWAGRILGHNKMGLAWFLNEYYAIAVSKQHQKADWAKRPLTESQLTYAQTDTHYLLQLRDHLEALLEAKGCLEEAREIFANECRVCPPDREFDPESFWKIRGARSLSPRSQAVLRALHIFRDREAQRRDNPPFKVISNDKLLLLAEYRPQSLAALAAVPGMPPRLIDRLGGKRLLRVIGQGMKAPLPRYKRAERQNDPGVGARYRLLLDWRKEVAQARGVESDVVMTRQTLMEIAQRAPRTPEELAQVSTLGPCRWAMYAQEVLHLLA